MKGFFGSVLLTGIAYFFASAVVEAWLDFFLPAWIAAIAVKVVFVVILLVLLTQGKSGLMEVFKITFWTTAPFWAWYAADYVILKIPGLTNLMPVGEIEVTTAAISPAAVALAGWAYWWFFNRIQVEISRGVVIPIAMVYHIFVITALFIQGAMTELVFAWAMGSLVITFFLAGVINEERRQFFGNAALFVGCLSAISFTIGAL